MEPSSRNVLVFSFLILPVVTMTNVFLTLSSLIYKYECVFLPFFLTQLIQQKKGKERKSKEKCVLQILVIIIPWVNSTLTF